MADQRRRKGAESHSSGMYSEFMIIRHLTYHAHRKNDLYLSVMQNLPEDFVFTEFQSVWSYKSSPPHKRDIQVGIFARAKAGAYPIIGEVKHRGKKKFSRDESLSFKEKAGILTDLEKVEKAVLCVFSESGFTKDALKYMREQNMAWTQDRIWMDEDTKFDAGFDRF